jgi:hypothetical protein
MILSSSASRVGVGVGVGGLYGMVGRFGGYILAIAGTGEVRRSAKRATVPSDCDGNERYSGTAQNQTRNGGESID